MMVEQGPCADFEFARLNNEQRPTKEAGLYYPLIDSGEINPYYPVLCHCKSIQLV